MFRFIIYLYDAAHASTPPQLREFLTYFFILPNYYFVLFPVIDFQTHRQSYFRRNIHDIAQQGIAWIGRGIDAADAVSARLPLEGAVERPRPGDHVRGAW